MQSQSPASASATRKRIKPFLYIPYSTSDEIFSRYFCLLDSSPSARHLRRLHGRLLRLGLLSDVILGSKLLLQYSRHGELLSSAYPFFLSMPIRNHFSFSILIGELSRSGKTRLAAKLFAEMRAHGLPLDAPTAALALRSHAGAAAHSLCVKLGLAADPFVASAGVFFYASKGLLRDARAVFDETSPRERDTVLWTGMLSAYSQAGMAMAAVELFSEMMAAAVKLDGVALVAFLLACSRLGFLLHGKTTHCFFLRRGIPLGLTLGNAIVDMYAKCGELRYSEQVFRQMKSRDVISWSSVVLGHGLHGGAARALELFAEMGEAHVSPNGVTYLGVLSACAHAGLVEKAWAFWEEMEGRGVERELKHYACMVDGLARKGMVIEAEELVRKMETEMVADEAVWAALLAACRTHGEWPAAERAARQLLQLRPEKSGYYALMANVLSDAGRHEDAEKVRKMMKEMNVDKLPGLSST